MLSLNTKKTSLENKRLLVLGGMRISCEIVRKAKEMGLYVMVTDYNRPEKSPAKQIADKSFMVSTIDVDAVVELIKREKVDGVLVGFVDLLLPYYAEICEKAGLPAYGTKEQFELFTNKISYKKLLRKFNVPTIPEYNIGDLEKGIIDFPVIVKPTESSGARGITVCYNKEDLKTACQKAKEASIDEKVIIERYLDEKEATVFWVFDNGNYYVAMIGNRHVKHNQEGVIPLPAGYSYPAAVTDRYLEEVAPKAKKMFSSIGIKNGMMFMQCKVLDGKCLVYDIGYRLTGSLEYKNLAVTCGYDPLEMMIHFAVTGRMMDGDLAPLVNPYLGKYTYNVSRLCAPGKIGSITGREEIKKWPGVIDVVTAHQPGETITESMKGLLAQITVRVLGTSDDEEAVYNDIKIIQDKIRIISDTGKDISLEGIEREDLVGMVADIHKICKE